MNNEIQENYNATINNDFTVRRRPRCICGILYFKVNGIDVIKKQVTKPCLKSASYEYSKQVGKNGITMVPIGMTTVNISFINNYFM